jgi:hypothetical protein
MKQVFILVSAMFFSSIAVFAQEQKKEIKQSIQKEVFLEGK